VKYKTEVLNEREKTHGDYRRTAAIAQELKTIINHCDGGLLSAVQAESLDMICSKISRILSGNPSEPDHWRDIAGYATLVIETLAHE
jgi:hypothetical protein